jgi:hypothetical protein
MSISLSDSIVAHVNLSSAWLHMRDESVRTVVERYSPVRGLAVWLVLDNHKFNLLLLGRRQQGEVIPRKIIRYDPNSSRRLTAIVGEI